MIPVIITLDNLEDIIDILQSELNLRIRKANYVVSDKDKKLLNIINQLDEQLE